MVRTETVLESWKTVRLVTVQAVEDFPDADLDFKPARRTAKQQKA
jgi:hypothetical protein